MKIPFLSRFIDFDMANSAPKITYSSALGAGLKSRLATMLTGIIADLPDLLAVTVADLKTGDLLATHHLTGKTNPAKATAYTAAIIRQEQLAVEALGQTDESIEDILVTLSSQWHVLRLLPGNRHFVHLMVSSRDTNLAIARAVIQSHAAATAPAA